MSAIDLKYCAYCSASIGRDIYDKFIGSISDDCLFCSDCGKPNFLTLTDTGRKKIKAINIATIIIFVLPAFAYAVYVIKAIITARYIPRVGAIVAPVVVIFPILGFAIVNLTKQIFTWKYGVFKKSTYDE